ncbi:ADP-L-glycero-D-manno-heptose 6-epimerase [Humitalea rosea]|uniref:ADP-L-glycero-D-manno-heptose-6-epimerase n=1 Tax=Humitalea rosea TaxID=990373 RepID=A0A2W7J2C6_9PROT|nr:ADP-glyceromanno-heptose 6-epimerase [Humitalea rosea]PZW45739.1 ADP-L-glycero-D-manno-heptose 6-epimerase [Humitalea rosea]
MYLVTGGAGFIGSNITAALCDAGHEVLVCDRLRDGEKWRNIARHPIAGLLAPEALPEFLETARDIQAVVHMGAISATTATDADLVAHTNLTLTLRLWDWCAAKGVPFIYASSAATYGDGNEGFEDDPSALATLRPLNLYGWSKHATDRRIQDLLARGRPRPPSWAGLKFFNVYGPNEAHKGRMASVVLHKYRQIAAGEPATLFASDRPGIADGDQRRDFVHVEDCVQAVLWLLAHPQAGGLFNIGSGQARSFLDLTRAIYAALGRAPDIRFVPMPPDLAGKYQYFTQAPLGRLRAAGYDRPATSLEDGVGDYVRRFLTQADPYR